MNINQNTASIGENDQSYRDELTLSIIDLENVPRDESGGRIATISHIASCGKTNQSDFNIVDLTVLPSQKANHTDPVTELNLKIDDILDVDLFDNIIEY